MARQLGTVLLGMLLTVLLSAGAGLLLYRLSNIWPEHTLGAIGRYLGNPLIAFTVGAVVGTLASSRASLLAMLSLVPMVAGTAPYVRRLDPYRALFMTLLLIAYLAIGMFVAAFVAKNRARSRASIAK